MNFAIFRPCGTRRALSLIERGRWRRSSGVTRNIPPTKYGGYVPKFAARRAVYGYRVYGHMTRKMVIVLTDKLLIDPYARELVGGISGERCISRINYFMTIKI